MYTHTTPHRPYTPGSSRPTGGHDGDDDGAGESKSGDDIRISGGGNNGTGTGTYDSGVGGSETEDIFWCFPPQLLPFVENRPLVLHRSVGPLYTPTSILRSHIHTHAHAYAQTHSRTRTFARRQTHGHARSRAHQIRSILAAPLTRIRQFSRFAASQLVDRLAAALTDAAQIENLVRLRDQLESHTQTQTVLYIRITKLTADDSNSICFDRGR